MNNNKVFVIPHFDRENFQVYERNTLFRLVLLKNNFLEREREMSNPISGSFQADPFPGIERACQSKNWVNGLTKKKFKFIQSSAKCSNI